MRLNFFHPLGRFMPALRNRRLASARKAPALVIGSMCVSWHLATHSSTILPPTIRRWGLYMELLQMLQVFGIVLPFPSALPGCSDPEGIGLFCR